MSADITRVIRKPVAIEPSDLDMSTEGMTVALVARSSSCHHGQSRSYCTECAHARRMFAAVPRQSRALVGGAK